MRHQDTIGSMGLSGKSDVSFTEITERYTHTFFSKLTLPYSKFPEACCPTLRAKGKKLRRKIGAAKFKNDF
jgi:hypothetical protein